MENTEVLIIENNKVTGYRLTENKSLVIPDGVTAIAQKVFAYRKELKSVYIPDSVEVIEKDAFLGCKGLKIYCEGEVKSGWIDTVETITERCITEDDDAFNFHRSSGGWSYHTSYRDVPCKWNPDKCKVHTHISKEEYAELTKND